MNRHVPVGIAAVIVSVLLLATARAAADSRDSHSRSHPNRGHHDRGGDRHDDRHRGHEHDRDRNDHRESHGHHGSHGSHGHHGHTWGQSSHRKSCGHIGACPTRSVQVCTRAGYYENRYVPAVTRVCYDSCHRPYTVIVKPACWTKVWVPARYETRHVSACSSSHGYGYRSGSRSGFSFSLNF